MASLVKDLVDAGIHFGHRATNWNPKMGPYIFGKRNKIHIIDVKATIKGLLLARKFVTRTVANGKDILFVGTKRQARVCIEKHVVETGMHWVTERWLGGALTNFATIRQRLKRLEESGEIDNYSKKMESQLRREKTKILRNLEGIRNMTKMPGAIVVIDVNREINAVREARKLGIKIVAVVDTNSDPDAVDYPIPGNDDAIRAIELFTSRVADAVIAGKRQHNERFSGGVSGDEDGLGPVEYGQHEGGPEVAIKPAGMEMPTPEASASPDEPAEQAPAEDA